MVVKAILNLVIAIIKKFIFNFGQLSRGQADQFFGNVSILIELSDVIEGFDRFLGSKTLPCANVCD